MVHEHLISFGPFRLETIQGRLWRGEQPVPLRRRSFAMLRYLAEHPGRLVTKAELREHLWTETHVTDTVLRVCVREIRAALGDTAAVPQYLQTVGGQGYKFSLVGDGDFTRLVGTGPVLVGRQREVATLEGWFQRAISGARQLVFLSGDAGIGKTTVLDLWLARLDAARPVRIGRGQCTEHYGEAEPYLPLLDALGRLAQGPQGHDVLAVLRRHAPMWLLQLPGLLSDTELERVQRQVQGATQARMLRELAEALAVLTATTPLVLVLEDLHWSDHATVAFLTALAQRRDPARLLVLGTYRPVETVLRAHPLRGMVQELVGRGHGVELRLELLPAEDVAAYVAGRLGGPGTAALAEFIYDRTEGNALFMVHLVEHLLHYRLLTRREGQWTLPDGAETTLAQVPEGVRQLLRRRIEALPPATRRILETASIAGEAFAVAAVAAGAQCPVEEVETVCAGLAAQQHFLDDTGLTVWPDGTRGGSYRFRHALYAQVLYEHLGSTRRIQGHRRVGDCLAAGYGPRAVDIAAQLAVHFERGGEVERAVQALQQAADTATRRNAHHDAVTALTKGLALLATLPDGPARAQQELTLRLLLGPRLMAAQGYAVPAVGETYSRILTLAQQVGEPLHRCQALQGLASFHLIRAQLRTADEVIQQLCRLAPHQPDGTMVLASHINRGFLAFFEGDPAAARAHLEQSLRFPDAPPAPQPLFISGYEARVTILPYLARTLWTLGYPDQAQQRMQDMLVRAQQVAHTPSLAWAHLYRAILAQYRRDAAATQAAAETVLGLATAYGLAHRIAHGRILWGWARAMQGEAATGVVAIQQGLGAVQQIGQQLYRPYFLALLAEAYGLAGQPEAGLSALDEAVMLVEATEERWWEAEVSRLKGELLLQLPCPEVQQAGTCFQQALAVAQRQQAKAVELRAALSLSRLWQQQGKREEAYQLLVPLYSWFTEGSDTADLQQAKALIEE
jgi:predicted ATPase